MSDNDDPTTLEMEGYEEGFEEGEDFEEEDAGSEIMDQDEDIPSDELSLVDDTSCVGSDDDANYERSIQMSFPSGSYLRVASTFAQKCEELGLQVSDVEHHTGLQFRRKIEDDILYEWHDATPNASARSFERSTKFHHNIEVTFHRTLLDVDKSYEGIEPVDVSLVRFTLSEKYDVQVRSEGYVLIRAHASYQERNQAKFDLDDIRTFSRLHAFLHTGLTTDTHPHQRFLQPKHVPIEDIDWFGNQFAIGPEIFGEDCALIVSARYLLLSVPEVTVTLCPLKMNSLSTLIRAKKVSSKIYFAYDIVQVYHYGGLLQRRKVMTDTLKTICVSSEQLSEELTVYRFAEGIEIYKHRLLVFKDDKIADYREYLASVEPLTSAGSEGAAGRGGGSGTLRRSGDMVFPITSKDTYYVNQLLPEHQLYVDPSGFFSILSDQQFVVSDVKHHLPWTLNGTLGTFVRGSHGWERVRSAMSATEFFVPDRAYVEPERMFTSSLKRLNQVRDKAILKAYVSHVPTYPSNTKEKMPDVVIFARRLIPDITKMFTSTTRTRLYVMGEAQIPAKQNLEVIENATYAMLNDLRKVEWNPRSTLVLIDVLPQKSGKFPMYFVRILANFSTVITINYGKLVTKAEMPPTGEIRIENFSLAWNNSDDTSDASYLRVSDLTTDEEVPLYDPRMVFYPVNLDTIVKVIKTHVGDTRKAPEILHTWERLVTGIDPRILASMNPDEQALLRLTDVNVFAHDVKFEIPKA